MGKTFELNFIIPGADRLCLYQTQNQRSVISDTSCTREDILTLKSQAFIYTGSNDARQVPRLNLSIMRVLYVIKFLVDPREFFNYLNQVFYRAFLFHSTAVIDLSMQANEWSFFKAKPLRVKEAPNKGEVRQREGRYFLQRFRCHKSRRSNISNLHKLSLIKSG